LAIIIEQICNLKLYGKDYLGKNQAKKVIRMKLKRQAVTLQPTLRKTLGVFDGIAILIGTTIGAGIYSTPQIIA